MYSRKTITTVIDKSDRWHAGGCNTYSFYNQSNVNVTFNDAVVLRPGQSFEGPAENPDIIDESSFVFQFDMVNDPTVVQPDTGTMPVAREYVLGDAVPERDLRLIIFSSFITKKT